MYLNSSKFINYLSKIFSENIHADFGLHGAGINIMKGGLGKLNPHLDNNIHPKTKLKRKYNLLFFLHKEWKESWGGNLNLYSTNKKNKNLHGKLKKIIVPKQNRLIIFDTSKNSWHGVGQINKNGKVYRKSIATYYFVKPKIKEINRQKVLYSPLGSQISDKKVLNFIKKRSSIKTFSKNYINLESKLKSKKN